MDDAELGREFDRLIQACGKDRVRKMATKKCPGEPGRREKNDDNIILVLIHLLVQRGKRKKTAARHALHVFQLPVTDRECDRLRNLYRKRKAVIEAFLTENRIEIAEGNHPEFPEPIFDVDELLKQHP